VQLLKLLVLARRLLASLGFGRVAFRQLDDPLFHPLARSDRRTHARACLRQHRRQDAIEYLLAGEKLGAVLVGWIGQPQHCRHRGLIELVEAVVLHQVAVSLVVAAPLRLIGLGGAHCLGADGLQADFVIEPVLQVAAADHALGAFAVALESVAQFFWQAGDDSFDRHSGPSFARFRV
jgi:hypothetical protein